MKVPQLLARLYPYTAYIELAGIVLGVFAVVADLVFAESQLAATLGFIGVVVFGTGLLLQLSSLPSTIQVELQAFDNRLNAVVDSTARLERVVTDLEKVVYLPTIQEVAAYKKDPRTSRIINRVVRSEVWGDVVAAIGAYREVAEGNKGYAEFKQPAQTYSGMLAVLDGLEPGSGWFGVTRIQDVDAWDPRWLPAWDLYQEQLKNRLADGSLSVFRVYSIDREPTPAQLDFYQQEARAGMVVKYLVDAADDITAIYEPIHEPLKSAELMQRLDSIGAAREFHARLRGESYEPAFGLDFFVDRSVLWRLRVHSKESEIQSRLNGFVQAWRNPKSVLVPAT
ncbi:MAG: hypothetical protein AAF467_26545 [Actinomycetota bacterium]